MHSRVLSFVAFAASIAAGCGLETSSPMVLAHASEAARVTPAPRSVNVKLDAVARARELVTRVPTVDAAHLDVDEVASECTPSTPPRPSTPAIVFFDVVSATPTSIDLAWQANAVSSCELVTNGDFADAVSVAPFASVTLTSSTESGLRTYQLRCTTADGALVDSSLSVLWGDARSVQDLIGVRALVGNLIQQTTDFITDFDNTDLTIVTGDFELDFDPLAGCAPVSVAFSALETIGANLILVDNAGVARFSFPRLVSVGDGIDITGDAQLSSIDFPALTSMGTTSTFAAQQDPLLSCDELASVYCALAQRGPAFVPECPPLCR